MSSRYGSPSAPYSDWELTYKQYGTRLLLAGLHHPVQQPRSSHQLVSLDFKSIVSWSRDGAHLLLEEAGDSHAVITVLDIHTGSLTKVGSGSAFGKICSVLDWLSPSKDALLLPEPEQDAALCIYSLPSL